MLRRWGSSIIAFTLERTSLPYSACGFGRDSVPISLHLSISIKTPTRVVVPISNAIPNSLFVTPLQFLLGIVLEN
jgi:hypothetical protein